MRVSVIPSWPLSRRLREVQVKIHNVTGSTAYTVLSKIRSKKTIRQSTCKTTCMIKIFMSSVNLSDCQTCRMTQTGKKKAGHVLVYKRTGETYSTYLGPTRSDGDDCCFLQPLYCTLSPHCILYNPTPLLQPHGIFCSSPPPFDSQPLLQKYLWLLVSSLWQKGMVSTLSSLPTPSPGRYGWYPLQLHNTLAENHGLLLSHHAHPFLEFGESTYL